jgi:hypothetical protein
MVLEMELRVLYAGSRKRHTSSNKVIPIPMKPCLLILLKYCHSLITKHSNRWTYRGYSFSNYHTRGQWSSINKWREPVPGRHWEFQAFWWADKNEDSWRLPSLAIIQKKINIQVFMNSSWFFKCCLITYNKKEWIFHWETTLLTLLEYVASIHGQSLHSRESWSKESLITSPKNTFLQVTRSYWVASYLASNWICRKDSNNYSSQTHSAHHALIAFSCVKYFWKILIYIFSPRSPLIYVKTLCLEFHLSSFPFLFISPFLPSSPLFHFCYVSGPKVTLFPQILVVRQKSAFLRNLWSWFLSIKGAIIITRRRDKRISVMPISITNFMLPPDSFSIATTFYTFQSLC